MPPSCNNSLNWSCLPAPSHLSVGNYAPHAILMMAVRHHFADTVCRGGRLCPPAFSGFLRTQRNAFLNPFFSFSARKKRTVSIFQEKKEGKVRTVVLNLTQKISAISCPSRQTLPPERSLRSAHRGVRRSQLHSASAGAAKAPYPLAPSSFPNCDRCAGSQFGVIWGGQIRLGARAVT